MARAPAPVEIEDLPEADRLEGFPHPRETAVLHGHAEAERILAEALAGGAMHHGWLLMGPEGVGKATLAYKFAAHALARPEDRDPSRERLAVPASSVAARQVRALSHPGLMVVRRPWNHKDKRFVATIPVDEVRRLRAFLNLRADDGAWRVVIVDTADELNLNAANALLKMLEEPPPRAVFLLISSEPGRLLATIRSRCRALPLAPVSKTALRDAIGQALGAEKTVPSGAEWTTLERLAEGSIRRGLALLAGGGLELDERLAKLLASPAKFDWVAAHALADELQPAAAEQRFDLFFDLLAARLGRMIRAAAIDGASDEEPAAARRLIDASHLAAWAELWETIGREKAIAQSLNLDRKALILDAFARIEALARMM